MQFDGRLGIISGRYHSLDGSGTDDHQTILEVFGRCEDGRSVCLLIKGVQPSFEITPLTAWQEGQGARRGQGAGEARGLAGGGPLRGGEPRRRRRLPQRHPNAG